MTRRQITSLILGGIAIFICILNIIKISNEGITVDGGITSNLTTMVWIVGYVVANLLPEKIDTSKEDKENKDDET